MTILYQKDWINEEWFTPEYQAVKQENFNKLDEYLKNKPKRILNIGCGLAWESRLFNQKYDSELYLLDGDFDDNLNDGTVQMQARYSADAKNFAFYYKLDFIKSELDRLGTKNYTLVDCNKIEIDKHIKFDLITSWVSCGFHYPVSTYKNLILNHSHSETIVVMDLRVPAKSKDPIVEDCFYIKNVINRRQKYLMSHIEMHPLTHMGPTTSAS